MHITPEFMQDLAKHVKRPKLPASGEITKTMAIRYLAPEILQLRILGLGLEEVRRLLEEQNLQVSLPLLLKTLRPATLLADGGSHG